MRAAEPVISSWLARTGRIPPPRDSYLEPSLTLTHRRFALSLGGGLRSNCGSNSTEWSWLAALKSEMHKLKPLSRRFYEPSAAEVAPKLLGHWLVRQTPDGPIGGVIVETEAYLFDDPACHAAPGLTERNRVMFGAPGHAYVYFIYGCHYCVNAVCQPHGTAEAVLIRAVEASLGKEMLRRNRPAPNDRELTNGPAKLCQAMAIDRSLDGADLCDGRSPLLIAENPQVEVFRKRHQPMVTTARIGITRAAELPLRFYLEGSAFVSKRGGLRENPVGGRRRGPPPGCETMG